MHDTYMEWCVYVKQKARAIKLRLDNTDVQSSSHRKKESSVSGVKLEFDNAA